MKENNGDYSPRYGSDVRKYCVQFPLCGMHTHAREHCEMGEMLIPAYPMQIISADLAGSFMQSYNGNLYLLRIIDHLSGWAETYPIPNKKNEAVWKMLQEVET